jgi:hypothetical protein
VGIRCADNVTPLYPQKLAVTSPTGGGRSVGVVLSRTKATEFIFIFYVLFFAVLTISVLCCLHATIYRKLNYHYSEEQQSILTVYSHIAVLPCDLLSYYYDVLCHSQVAIKEIEMSFFLARSKLA